MVSIQFVELAINAGFIFLNYMIPSYDLNNNFELPAWVFMFYLGLNDGLTVLLLTLLGPLLVAASARQSYEITMGGTSIAMCVATPFVFGTIIGVILIAIGSVCSY